MTWTNIHLTSEVQSLLIKAAASQKVSVEELASKILSDAVKEKLAQNGEAESPVRVILPLASRQPYSYNANPEESALPADEWEAFQ
jgi:hypothetical protein